ncbi:hypothetical protein, partial [Dyadobacter sp. 50-39]|uniref:hypothetical protein n=1 Tax=Dyadobacter sp. 50-39 TaxID=1895756 RepID=UPI0025C4C9BC
SKRSGHSSEEFEMLNSSFIDLLSYMLNPSCSTTFGLDPYNLRREPVEVQNSGRIGRRQFSWLNFTGT